jgi:hypothetical protein
MAPDLPTGLYRSSIYNACRMVREYPRGARTSIGRLQRDQAILKLGLVVREAFSKSDDFEALLTALVDGLHRKDDPPF